MKKNTSFIHSSSIIDDDVEVGSGSKIWHWCHISKNATIGKNCILGQNTFVGPNVQIGDNCKIQNNVSIYEGLIISNNVFIGPSVVFTNVINPRALIERKQEFKKTIVNEGVSIGANSTIVCGIELGKFSFIGAASVVTKSVSNFSLVYGNPAKHKGWISRAGIKLNLPEIGNGISSVCLKSNKKYILKKDLLLEIEI